MAFDWSQTVQTAEKHLSRGKISEAIAEYRTLCDWDPSDLTVLNTLGDLCARAALNDEAKDIFSRVAEGYRHRGFTLKAIAVLKKMVRIDPADLDSAGSLAECYLTHGLRGEAGRQYGQIAAAYERAGHEDKALATCQRMAEIDPSNTSLLMMLGDRWLAQGLTERANANFVAAGDEYARQGNDERALQAYSKAHSLQPDEYKTLAAIASIYAARGQADQAIPILCQSLERKTSDVKLHRLLGSTYLSAGRLVEAQQTFQKLLTLDAEEYCNLLIVGEKFLETGDLDRAVEQIDGIVDLLIANRHEQEAVDFLRKATDRDPRHPGSLKLLAMIFRRMREDFNLAPVLKTLANSALRRGAREEAIEALKELCVLEPHEREHIDSLEHLGIDPPEIPFGLWAAADSAWGYAQTDSGFGCSSESMAYPELSADDAFDIFEQNISLMNAPSVDFEFIPTADRRRTPRVSARVPLVVISDTGGWREFTETVDVAETGLKFRLAHSIPPMTALRVTFETAKWPDLVTKPSVMNATNAIVQYCEQRLGQPNLVGVDLRSMPDQ